MNRERVAFDEDGAVRMVGRRPTAPVSGARFGSLAVVLGLMGRGDVALEAAGEHRRPALGFHGAILSPLLAKIALSALDDHFDRQWHQEMGTDAQRRYRRRHGQGNWKLIR